jgi:hypothetical protein
LVDGKDIMKILQMPAGPEVGKIKNDLEQAYLDGKISTRSDAVLMLEKYR